ncbi:MAG: DUF5103 domain-containing protein [Bacteroidota bacterium]
MKTKILLLFFIGCFSFSKAQEIKIYKDFAFDKNIKTAKFKLNDLFLSEPIIGLNGSDELILSFDDLSEETRNLSYSFQLCNADWTPNTELSTMDYLQGFADNPMLDYKRSFNTSQLYTHFNLKLPNENIRFKKSGNYVVIIKDNNSSEIVLTKRFMVNDNKAVITGTSLRPRNVELSNTNQQLDIQVDCKGINTSNPFEEIKVVILQNNRWDNALTGIQPNFVQDNILKYNSDVDLLFPAMKEFRKIDIRTTRLRTARIDKIDNDSTISKFYVSAEPLRSFKSYYYEKDWNGDYIVEKQEAVNQDVEADYVWVNWKMPFSTRLVGGDFYICGRITNWDTIPEFKMNYNFKTNAYEAKALLKQGFYEYQIGYFEPENKKFDMTPAEGNWYETENQYTILVYYKPFAGRYDQLIGVTTIRTMK